MQYLNSTSISIDSKKIAFDSMQLVQDINNHHHFVIECSASQMGDDNGYLNPEDIYYYLGHHVNISVKSKNKSDRELKFKGIIKQIEMSKTYGVNDQVQLIGQSDTILLDDCGHIQTFEEMTITDIAKKVLEPGKDYLKTNISDDVTIPYITQHRETPYDFIARLAFTHGLWFYYDGQKLHLGDWKENNSFDLVSGPDIGNLDLNLTMHPLNIGYSHYNYKTDEKFNALGSDAPSPEMDKFGQSAFDVSIGMHTTQHNSTISENFEDKKELEKFISHRINARAAQMLMLYGNSSNPGIHLGTKLNIQSRKNNTVGSYVVVHVEHSTDGQGHYNNRFQAIPAALKTPPPNPHVRIPKAHTQVARVTDVNDPENLGRVRVNFPWQQVGDQTPWIRCLYPHAGGGEMYFQPELKDEVMIGFEFDNPDRPYVMGSLYHKGSELKFAKEDNTVKGIRTKCGHELSFHEGDEGEIKIKVNNDKAEICLLVQEDGVIQINADGMLDFYGKTVNISGDEINITAESALNIEAGQDLKMKGANASMEADQAASIKGMEAKVTGDTSAEVAGAQVKVEGSAMAVLKGGMVQIN